MDAIRRSGAYRIIDLCAGAGGAWRNLLRDKSRELTVDLKIILTDLYPNHDALSASEKQFPQQVKRWPEPVDARNPGKELDGFFTLFTAAHHFDPQELTQILRQAVEKGTGVALFEMSHRSVRGLLLTCLVPVAHWLIVPFFRPVPFSRLFWTYLVPLIPLISFYDGLASCLRSYRPHELEQIVAGLGENLFEWQIGERSTGYPIPVTYLIGIPRN